MKRVRFTEEQMVTILCEADKNPVAEIAKKHKISEQQTKADDDRLNEGDADDALCNGPYGRRGQLRELGAGQRQRSALTHFSLEIV